MQEKKECHTFKINPSRLILLNKKCIRKIEKINWVIYIGIKYLLHSLLLYEQSLY